MLSDHQITSAVKSGDLGITPFDASLVQPASIDLRLADGFLTIVNDVIDPYDETTYLRTSVGEGFYLLQPKAFALASTIEAVSIPRSMVARLEGKSSLARLGLIVHSTAGFVDPGFSGDCTLELFNCTHVPIKLWPGMKICQMSFELLHSSAHRPYGTEGLGSKYQYQQGATGSRMHYNA